MSFCLWIRKEFGLPFDLKRDPKKDREDRVHCLRSPIVTCGDIHGNLRDLQILDRGFWEPRKPFSSFNALLLGDYVDR